MAFTRCLFIKNCIGCRLSRTGRDVNLDPFGSAHFLDSPNMRAAIAKPLSGQAAPSRCSICERVGIGRTPRGSVRADRLSKRALDRDEAVDGVAAGEGHGEFRQSPSEPRSSGTGWFCVRLIRQTGPSQCERTREVPCSLDRAGQRTDAVDESKRHRPPPGNSRMHMRLRAARFTTSTALSSRSCAVIPRARAVRTALGVAGRPGNAIARQADTTAPLPRTPATEARDYATGR